ncbi:MAG: hypothetical protein HRT42_10830 [Campylobacteraceae bacterium]|nr:hypothetical protein [Campylobacteraceae bacterium]
MEENFTNELIREYIPKKSKFNKVSRLEITNIQNRLNNRPLIILEYITLNQMFFNNTESKLSSQSLD